MTIAYFDCFAGAAGDMIVGALLDAGADFAELQRLLDGLGVHGYHLAVEKVRRQGLAGTKFHVNLDHHHDHEHRNLADIIEIIARGKLPARAARRAEQIFTRLGEAESKVHGIGLQEVHFHEVGAIDSIMDIVGTCVAMESLDVDRVLCSPIPAGSGTIQCAHGTLPAPAPATALLLSGAAIAQTPLSGEVTTPTGAAILTALSEGYGPLPAMELSAVGCGAGTRDGGQLPNLLRVFLGRRGDGQADSLVELAANLDDCPGELLGATLDKLLGAGCVDAWAAPIYMKKSRPAWTLYALCGEADRARAEAIIFQETTTLGVRRRGVQRSKLLREWQTVETPYGPIRVKLGRADRRVVNAAPEFADCLAAAEAHHVPVKEVLAAAQAAYRKEAQE